MKSIVFQSYRTDNVPDWIKTCMQTVRAWADANAFDYRFVDDSFFSYTPDWFRQKANHEICPVTDFARLAFARELLSQGYERTIWVDADMLVFDPDRLTIDLTQDFSFCHEVWLFTDATGACQVSHRVNNSISVFCKNNVHLDFFIDACLRIGREKEHIGKLDIGTVFLSQLRSIVPFALMENVGILSPDMMKEIFLGKPQHLVEYAQNIGAPVACANLCDSLHDQNIQGGVADNAMYEHVVQALLTSRGDVINLLRQRGQ